MQIHEITTLSENFLKRLATDARNDAFKKSTGVDWNTYKLAQTAGQSTTPAATTSTTLTTPTTTPTTPITTPTTTPTTTPVGSNAGNVLNPPGMTQNAAAAKAAAEKPAGDPEVLDPVAKAAQKPAAAKPGDVIDVDARVVPDPARVAKLPQPAPAPLPKPVAQSPTPVVPAQLPRPVAAPNFAQTNRTKYQPATINAPVAKVPNMPATLPPKTAAPVVNPAAKPVVYTLDGQPLNPSNPVHARLIAQMQAAGLTKASAPNRKIKR